MEALAGHGQPAQKKKKKKKKKTFKRRRCRPLLEDLQ